MKTTLSSRSISKKIPFLVGIICGGWKSSFFSDFLSQTAGIQNEYSEQEYRIKDPKSLASDYSYGAKDDLGNFHSIKMAKVGDMWGTGLFKSRACDFCTDVMTELADISLGDAWLPEYRNDGLGNNIIVTRSKMADLIISNGISSGELKVSFISTGKIIQSQLPSFAHRQDAIKFRLNISNFKGHLTPYIRKRVLKSISLAYSLVQIQRERTRYRSFKYWKESKNSNVFIDKINFDLKLLKYLTKIYHRLRNL
ncbi:Coenzyme F420 hydrogenase/dehydrogenase, beta subunit C-terminal domain [Algoriphagus boritolerans]|uniref:Coenzyme F420 hydrogenase/dehydrogenase, beta subunit C-terminal domain n=1 Tax=Algoriphagus boritolerans TaxID=308111 RepID=UPI002FCE5448